MRRGLALIRVSKVGDRDDLLSPEIQRRAIIDYAQRNDITVTDWQEVLDQSASQSRSRWWATLDQAVEAVEAGRVQVVLVWKYSRAARHRRRWAVALDRIEIAGGTLESATEGLDTRTSTGRLARGVLAELTAWEAEVKGEQWKEAQALRLARGLPANGRDRFGYVYSGKQFAPDPVTGPLLAECYARYLNGWSGTRLAAWLDTEGVLTARGNPFSATTILKTLDTGFGAGLIRAGDALLPGAHEPVIPAVTWQAYSQRRAEQKSVPPRVKAAKYELTGLLRCGHCESGISPRIPGREWACAGSWRGTCKPTVRIGEQRAIALLKAWVADVARGTDEALIAAQREAAKPAPDLRKWKRQQRQAEQRLVDLGRKNLTGFYDDQTYLLLRDEQQRLLDEAVKMQAQRPQPVDTKPFLTLAQSWDGLPPLVRREATLKVLRWAWVYRDNTEADVRNRARLVPVPRWVVL